MQKLLKYILLLVGLIVFSTSFSHAQTAKKYIQKYSNLVASLSAEYGIPVSIITAVSIIESGAGTSRNCKLLKNHFGVKGKNNLLKTKGIKSAYKQYKTDEDSFKDFCRIISRKKYYAKLKGNEDYQLWINAMANAKYSTKPVIWKKEMKKGVNTYKKYSKTTSEE